MFKNTLPQSERVTSFVDVSYIPNVFYLLLIAVLYVFGQITLKIKIKTKWSNLTYHFLNPANVITKLNVIRLIICEKLRQICFPINVYLKNIKFGGDKTWVHRVLNQPCPLFCCNIISATIVFEISLPVNLQLLQLLPPVRRFNWAMPLLLYVQLNLCFYHNTRSTNPLLGF